MRAVEDKISDLKKNKYRELTVPVAAFITFEEEVGYNTALEFEEKDFLGNGKESPYKLLGTDMYFTSATEPTNIIWENR